LNYYETIFALAQHHNYSITEIESLMPFERDLYIQLLLDYLQKKEKEAYGNG
jgi:hypothetical protein